MPEPILASFDNPEFCSLVANGLVIMGKLEAGVTGKVDEHGQFVVTDPTGKSVVFLAFGGASHQ